MNFRANDPGCVRYGNFINYYSFNPAENRIQLLPTSAEFWTTKSHSNGNLSRPYIALDIGCNSGNLTQLLWKFLSDVTFKEVYILGIDLDSALIERAEESNEHPEHISYSCVNILQDKDNILGRFLHHHGIDTFDVIFSFSLTMWIHLNAGDEGLKTFLKKCTELSKLFVVEPQSWRCYQTAVKRLRRGNEEFRNFPLLKWRSNVERDIQTYLEENLGQKRIYETEPTNWKRKICFYNQ